MKNNPRNILFTFDYELFLGARSGSVQNCLLQPTELLLDIFEKYSIRHAIFFVDTTYLLRLEKENNEACKKDFALISQQLQELVKEGHYVFPHIHPHWLDAVYQPEKNQWELKKYSKYRFHKATPLEREELFTGSIRILESILRKEAAYKLDGYRAGGWSLQPFEDFRPFFEQYGITHEFSVLPGFRNLSEAQYFDFSGCPDKVIYRFSTDPAKEDRDGKYLEYTISTLEITKRLYWLSRFWNKYLWKTGQRSLGDGSGVVIKDETATGGKKDLIGSENREMISIELLTRAKLPAYKRFLKEHQYMQFISHPKMLSLHNLSTFESFVRQAVQNYTLQTDYREMQPKG